MSAEDDDRIKIEGEEIEHVGYKPHRTIYDRGDLERIFAYHWFERNDARSSRSTLLLQSLLNDSGDEFEPMTQRDARVAATVVQWLGTNVGFSFVCQAFRDAGYDIREKKDDL